MIRLARGCLCARRVMGIEEVSQALRDTVAASRASLESTAFDRELETGREQENQPAGDGIVCGVLGWFRPRGVRYHEDIRSTSEITPADWSALLDHADAIDFSIVPNRRRPGRPITSFISPSWPEIVAASSRSMTPSRHPNSPHLITLTRRAMRDRQVLSPDMLNGVQFAALATAWLDARAGDPGDDPSR
ncbi:hypothetical protein NPJ82_17930 (plasmid) [Sphingomonas sp. NY01]|uniref:hypothetical protein n=1 Tax=Sphingomonas sp. NY01 TaxID=2968057 RepID=UPI00315C8631